jgi:hypothetical protein
MPVAPKKRRSTTTARPKRPASCKKCALAAVSRSRTTTSRAPRANGPNPNAPKYTWAPWGTSGVVHDNCYDYAFGSFSNNRTRKSIPGEAANISSNGLNFKTCEGIAKRVLADNPGNVYQMKNPDAKTRPGFYKVMCFVAPTNDYGNSTGDFHWYKEISGIRYKTRPNDKVGALARFFHVPSAVITAALAKARTSSANTNNGRVANDDTELRILDRMNRTAKGPALPVGRILDFPVKLWSHKTGWAGGPLIVDASGYTIKDPRKADRNYKPGFHYSKFCSAYAVRRGFAKTGNNSNRNGGSANRVLVGSR